MMARVVAGLCGEGNSFAPTAGEGEAGSPGRVTAAVEWILRATRPGLLFFLVLNIRDLGDVCGEELADEACMEGTTQKEAEGLVGCSYVLLNGTEMLRNFAF